MARHGLPYGRTYQGDAIHQAPIKIFSTKSKTETPSRSFLTRTKPTNTFILSSKGSWLAMISSLAKILTKSSSSFRRNLCLSKSSNRCGTCWKISLPLESVSLHRFISLFGAFSVTSFFLFQQKNGVEAQDSPKVQQEKIIETILNKICIPWKSQISQANWIQRSELEEKLTTVSAPEVCTILVGEHGTGKSSILSHLSEGKRVLYHKVSSNMDLVEVADAIFREYFFYSVDTKRISARETLQEVLKRCQNGEKRPIVILEVDQRENYDGIKSLFSLAKSLANNAQVYLTFTDSGIALAGVGMIQSDPSLRVIWVGDLKHDEAEKFLSVEFMTHQKPNALPKEQFAEIFERLGTRLRILKKVVSNDGELDTIVKELMSSEEGVANFDRLAQFHPNYPALVSALLDVEPIDAQTVFDIMNLKSINDAQFLNLHKFCSYDMVSKTFSFRSKLHREAAKIWIQENRERVSRNLAKEAERSQEM